jgi:hypothetical protein
VCPPSAPDLVEIGARILGLMIAPDHASCLTSSARRRRPMVAHRLHDLAAGKVTDARVPLTSWFNELVYPLFAQACFADPIYGGNVGKVFWKMIGYPGLPATHAQDMLDFRGKPYPDAADPKSIADFS